MTTNLIFTDSLARDHANALLDDAAGIRRARDARAKRRVSRTAKGGSSDRSARADRTVTTNRAASGSRTVTTNRAASFGHLLGRPLVAAQHWIAAGQL